MNGGIEAAGDIATGALLGRVVEPGAGDRAHGQPAGVCLNCGTALIGDFCHACGQNGHVHKTLRSIGHDLLHGVFHFEGKVWRTLPMLVTRPGSLTRRYIDGERARFVSPLAMFLFFVFLMFATLHSMSTGDFEAGLDPEKAIATAGDLQPQIAARQAQLAKVETDRDAARAKGQDTDALDEKRESLNEQIGDLRSATKRLQFGKEKAFRDPNTGWAALDHGIKKAGANPELALYKFQASAYKYSWAMIPISVPFVALLFLWRRTFKLYDHAIFVTYSLSFMLLLATIISLLLMVDAPAWIWGNLLAFAPPLHMFVQLRGTYGLRWFSALWRTFALLIFGSITLTLFAMLLLGLGMME